MDIFKGIMERNIRKFRNDFIDSSKEIFFQERKLIHPGEYGTFREKICSNFLLSFLPSIFDVGSGFVKN